MKKESWLDWIKPVSEDRALIDAQPMLTRNELVARLDAMGIGGSVARSMFYWQERGVIPGPTKRKLYRDNVYCGLEAIYPSWMPDLVSILKRERTAGKSFERIAEDLRIYVSAQYGDPSALPDLLCEQAARRQAERREQVKRMIVELQQELAELEQDGQ